MSNVVVISGNVVRDPSVSYTTGENSNAMARFTVAVQRDYKNAEGKYEADFPNVICFGQKAEFVSNYFHKGDRVEVQGQIRTGNYVSKKTGEKVYTTDVYVDSSGRVRKVGGNGSGEGEAPHSTAKNAQPKQAPDPFVNVPDGMDEELPFH